MGTLVSVCIPVFNGEVFIKETIEMILKQDYDNMEILVSDNESTDHTVEEIKKIKDSRIKLLQNERNLGMGGNWNSLMRQARGDYLLLVCADDYLLPGAIREKAKILDDNPDVNIVFSSSYVMNEKGRKLMIRRPFRKSCKLEARKMQQDLFVKRNIFAEPTNNMLRKSAMLEVGDFDTNLWYTIDWDYWLRMLNTGNAYYIDKPYSGFRISSSSATGSSLNGTEKILKDESVFIEKHKEGKIIPVTHEMIVQREKNVQRRLSQKIIFMRINTLISKILKDKLGRKL